MQEEIKNTTDLINYLKDKTNIMDIELVLNIYNQINNKKNILSIIKILDKDSTQLEFNVPKVKENMEKLKLLLGNPLNKEEINKCFDKIIYFVEKFYLYSFTIVSPNGINLPLSKTNPNFFEDLNSIYLLLEENSKNYDLNLCPMLLIGTKKEKISLNNKETYTIFANTISPVSVSKLEKEEIDCILSEELRESVNYIYTKC